MELFKLFGTIAVKNDEANKGIDETVDKAEKAHPKMSEAFGKIGSAALTVGKTVAKAAAAGLAAGSAALAALGKSAISSYADYEQLVGGVDTLFGESSKTVQQYAKNAYQTAGLSANEYMDTVTSFSASLLQSLDGDTARAAQVADRAITDMSDNANKMGTDISMIQNAYQGFAKQNFTMLDNLKLGYGGTKEEMERLISDANKLKEANGETADLTIESYADIVEAIGLVQDEMGITGTTAKEASTTIQGSIASMKSSWQNLLTAMTSEDMDVGAYLDSFVEAALTALDNIAPRIQQFLEGFGELVTALAPVIAEQLPALIESLLPSLIDGVVVMIEALVEALPELLQAILPSLIEGIVMIAEALIVALPEILSALFESVKLLFGSLFGEISVELLGTGVDFETVFAGIQAVVEGCWKFLQTLWETIGQPIWDTIQTCIGIVGDKFGEIMPQIQSFVDGCFSDIQSFWENNLKPCFDAIGDFIEGTLAPIFETVFEGTIGPVVDAAFKLIQDLWEGTLKPVFTGITDFLTGVFTLDFSQAFEGLISIVDGIWQGIVSVVKTPINTVIGVINGFIEGLNKLQVPDWVPLIGGKGINIPLIPLLEEGGILEKGQVGFLEGNGAEAVVPLDQNKNWISAVAKDMKTVIGGTEAVDVLEKILAALMTLDDGMQEKLSDAFESMKFDVNNREFARMVKAVG